MVNIDEQRTNVIAGEYSTVSYHNEHYHIIKLQVLYIHTLVTFYSNNRILLTITLMILLIYLMKILAENLSNFGVPCQIMKHVK